MPDWTEYVRARLTLTGVSRRRETELVEDLAHQLEDACAEALAAGAPLDDAERKAMSHVEDWPALGAALSRTWSGHGGSRPASRVATLLSALRQDLRYGVRVLRRSPGFALVTLAAIALGVGGTTAIFSVFEAVVLRPLPVRDPGRLVLFTSSSAEGASTGSVPSGVWTQFSYANYQALSRASLPVDLTAVRSGEGVVSARIDTRDARGAEGRALVHLVAGNYFDVMGVPAARGRMLTAADESRSAPPTAVISDGYWQRAFKADPEAIGATVLLNGHAFTIVGVADALFFGERVRSVPDAWVPLVFQPAIEATPFVDRTDAYWLTLIGRLRPGATREAAAIAITSALRSILRKEAGTELTAERRQAIEHSSVAAFDGSRGISGQRVQYSRPLQVLLAAVMMLLLIACANVATLLVARAAARRAEVGMRLALGASRSRVVRQLLTESALLAVVGGLAGSIIASWIVGVLKATLRLGPLAEPRLDASVLGFALAATGLSALIFGLVPAIDASRTDVLTVLKSGGRGTTPARRFGSSHGLVLTQIAASAVLLVGAALFARSLVNLEQAPLGFDGRQVLVGRISTRPARFSAAAAATAYRRLFDEANAIPGVRVASLGSFSPLNGYRSTSTITVEGYEPRPGESPRTDSVSVSPHYVEVLGMTIVEGRDLTLLDSGPVVKVALVNRAFVARYYPDGRALGRRFDVGPSAQSVEIVGVVNDARFNEATAPADPMAFLPIFQAGAGMPLDIEVELRSERDPAALTTPLRQLAPTLDSRLRVTGVDTLAHQVASNFDDQRLTADLVAIFGGLALLLAAVGLYGVVAQGVVRRTAEFGVRLALGARPILILRSVLGETLALVAAGLAIGVSFAILGGRLIAAQLVGVTPTDAVSYVASIVTLASVSTLAALLPALRASRVDPAATLR